MKSLKINLKKIKFKKEEVLFNSFLLVLIFAILGFLLASSFYTQEKAERRVLLTRRTELIETVVNLEKERKDLENELQKLREQLRKYEEKAAEEEGILASFKNELNKLKFKTGLTEVVGPGLEIVLGDNPNIPLKDNTENFMIHDYDLRTVVNALWIGGAEAIAINGQRLVSVSSIRCVGSTVLVNAVRLGSPFKIKAIGNPAKLKESLYEDKESAQLLDVYVRAFGLVFDLKEARNLRLPVYKGSLSVEYAKVIKGGK